MGKSEGSMGRKPLQAPVVQWPTTILPSLLSSAGSSTLCTNRAGEKACKCNGQTSQQSEGEEPPRRQMMTICTHDSRVRANAWQPNGLTNQTMAVCTHQSKRSFDVESSKRYLVGRFCTVRVGSSDPKKLSQASIWYDINFACAKK